MRILEQESMYFREQATAIPEPAADRITEVRQQKKRLLLDKSESGSPEMWTKRCIWKSRFI